MVVCINGSNVTYRIAVQENTTTVEVIYRVPPKPPSISFRFRPPFPLPARSARLLRINLPTPNHIPNLSGINRLDAYHPFRIVDTDILGSQCP